MSTQQPPEPRRSLTPDAHIIRPESQPQRYDAPPPLPSAPPFPADGNDSWWLLSGVREILTTILPAVLLALLIQLFLAQATRVESYSMEPTLFEEQRLLIDKVSYRLNPPDRGDIVVLHSPDGGSIPLVKRVVGLPGETLQVRDNRVFIDGFALDEPYLRDVTHGAYGPLEIPEDHIFVMGDNRDHSRDSRSFGAVALDDLVGRAWLRYWPLTQAKVF